MILRTFPVISGLWLNPVGVRLLEVFTLTPASSAGQALTLSLKGEGIAELRKSYPDRSQAVGQDAFTPSAGPGQVQPSGCTGWRLAVALACWRGAGGRNGFPCHFVPLQPGEGTRVVCGVGLIPGAWVWVGAAGPLVLGGHGTSGSLSGCMDFVLGQKDGDLRDVIIR